MMTDKKSIRVFIAFIIVVLFAIQAFAEEPSAGQASEVKPPVASEWRGGPQVGFSPYIGIIGVEIQKGNYAVSLGLPTCIGLKYYPDVRGYRWFYGVHAMHFSVEDRQTINNIPYNDSTVTYAGAGFGYKWRWWDHLDLTLSLSASYNKEKHTGPFGYRTEQSLGMFPGITLGYTF